MKESVRALWPDWSLRLIRSKTGHQGETLTAATNTIRELRIENEIFRGHVDCQVGLAPQRDKFPKVRYGDVMLTTPTLSVTIR